MSYRGKVILLGDAGVGKTSILARFIDDIFNEEYKQTVGANFLIKEIDLNKIILQIKTDNPHDVKEFKLYFWDIGGQSDKLLVTEYYFDQAVGALVIFNIVNQESFDNLNFWITKLKDLSGEIPFIIIGNKTDLEDKRIIDTKTLEAKAAEYGVKYIETSAKLNKNIDKAFEMLAIEILNGFQ